MKLHVLGLNCGTSVDGIDVAHVAIESMPEGDLAVELVAYYEHPMPLLLRKRILSLCRTGAETTLEEICDFNFELGELFADAALAYDLTKIDLIACHGQTLWHNPVALNKGQGYSRGERRLSTLQMAESAVLSQRTGLPVVNDFRVAELARQRMGAPLAGFFEAALIRHSTYLRVSQNIGGMGNVTVIPPDSAGAPTYSAFDTGPGNVLIDAAVRALTSGMLQFDQDGTLGKAGEADIDHAYVESFVDGLEYITRAPPKTTGRELFSDDMALGIIRDLRVKGVSAQGIVATITRISAETIARSYERFVVPVYGDIDEIFVCGGGAFNPNIMDFLRNRFPQAKVKRLDDATSPGPSPRLSALDAPEVKSGLPAAAKEAVLFAVLGFMCVSGMSVPIAHNEASGDEAVLGKITPGRGWQTIVKGLEGQSRLRRIIVC